MRARAALAAIAVLACPLGPGAVAASPERQEETPAFQLAWPGGTLDAGSERDLRWHRLRTVGRGEPELAVRTQPLRPGLDLRGRFLRVWLKVDSLQNLAGLELRLGSEDLSDYYAIAIPLYRDPDANLLQERTWTAFHFAFGDARRVGRPNRAGIEQVGLYVADTGRDIPVTVWWSSISIVDAPSSGVVSLTFDDGYDEHHDAARWMSEHGFRGTAYVIPGSVGAPGYMTLDELRELQEVHGWEVAAHHETPFTDLSHEALETTLLGIKDFLARHGFAGSGHLAYPLGKQDETSVRSLARKHFATARIAGGGVETLPPADPHLLRVRNVTDRTTPEEIHAAAERARDDGEWLILMFHYLVPEPRGATTYGIARFRAALEAIASTGVRVRPVGAVWREIAETEPSVAALRGRRTPDVGGAAAPAR